MRSVHPSCVSGTLIALGLAACGPPPPRSASIADSSYSSHADYMILTVEGDLYKARILDADEDSLWFHDGSALAREEIRSVRTRQQWLDEVERGPRAEAAPAKEGDGTPGKGTAVLIRVLLELFAR